MMAYELLARLKFLALSGRNADGDLEWIGTYQQWTYVSNFEKQYE